MRTGPDLKAGQPVRMITTQDDARRIALSYYEAWARRDIAGALDHVTDDVVCDGPAGHIEGVLAFTDLLSADFSALERTDLVAAFGDATSAVLIHRDQTMSAPTASAATHVTVEDGRIVSMRLSDGAALEAASARRSWCRPG